jgi:uncharacterized protein YggE
MTDATPVQDGSSAVSSTARSRSRLLVAGAVVAVAVTAGGVAAGVAAVVSRSTPAAQVGGGATLYIPSIGGGGSQPGSSGGGSVVNGAPAMAAGGMAAPQAALSFGAAQGGPAMSSTIAYPYPGGWCNGPATAAATGPGITATGLAQVTVASSQVSTQTLNVGVNSNDSGPDVTTALSDVEQRLAAIRDALHKAGVPDDHISQQGLNVFGNGNPKPSSMNANGSLTATISDPAVLDRAVRGAVAAGASNVNVWSASGAAGAAPDDKSLQSAIVKATDAARTMAQSQAQAAGVALGALQSTQAQPPSICGWSPGGAQMVVAVTLTYAVR